MDFSIDLDHVAMANSITKFIDREVVSLEDENKDILASGRTMFDATGRYVPEILELRKKVRTRSAELGFYTLFGAEHLGGSGMNTQAYAHVHETLYRRYGPSRTLIHHVVIPSTFTNGLSPVLSQLPPEVFLKYQDAIAAGEKTLCFALSEPDAGSDILAMKTRAVRDGQDWVITGTKQWITNSPYADYAMVFAVTDPEAVKQRKGGITGFFVDTKLPGFSIARIIGVMGQLGGDTGVINLDGVRVRDDHRLGPVGSGLSVAIGGVSAGRLGLAVFCLGLAEWALDLATEYAKVRKTFGVPISEHQAIQFMLADSAMDIYAAKSMLQNCSWRLDGEQSSVGQVSIVKAYCTEMLGRVVDRCIQIHGGMGLTNDVRLEAAYREARIARIPDGTGEMQRRTIARQLLAGRMAL